MEEEPIYVFALTEGQPDFIGKFRCENADEIVIERPFSVSYVDMRPVLNTEFMPLGMPPYYKDYFTVKVQKSRLLYIVYMDDSHDLVRKYLETLEEELKRLPENQ